MLFWPAGMLHAEILVEQSTITWWEICKERHDGLLYYNNIQHPLVRGHQYKKGATWQHYYPPWKASTHGKSRRKRRSRPKIKWRWMMKKKINQMGKTWCGIQVMAQDQLTDVKGLNCCPARHAGVMAMSEVSCCIFLDCATVHEDSLTVSKHTSIYFTTAHLRI